VESLGVKLVEVVLDPADDEVAAEAPVMPTPKSMPAVSTVAAPTARRFLAGVLNLVGIWLNVISGTFSLAHDPVSADGRLRAAMWAPREAR
jgi:hypothetical protein